MTAQHYLKATRPFFSSLKFDLPKEPRRWAIIVETRRIPDFGVIVKNHLHFLPKDFGLLVVHGDANAKFVEDELADVDGWSAMNIKRNFMSGSDYNRLLTSFNFWRAIPGETALVFQTDSLLLRHGIEHFLQYAYVGAPWPPSHINMVGGNGGLSIRSIPEMKRVTESVLYNESIHGNEDLHFCRHVQGVAPNHVAQQFSVETTFFPSPVGVHACDKYLKPDECRMIFEKAIKEINQQKELV